jgi:NF-X1-type zinc finger protein NFXL1
MMISHLQGTRTCPCGKEVYPDLSCTEAPTPCGATCGKLLPCGLHRCQERCHTGECSKCRALVNKSCRYACRDSADMVVAKAMLLQATS